LKVRSAHHDFSLAAFRKLVAGLPSADGYEVVLKPLRYRSRPHLAAETDFDGRTITIRLPEPFLPFGEVVAYGARRAAGSRMRFIWLTEGITFRTPREVVRFLYCHEWMHWFLKERLGRKSAAETTCDRFALWNYQRSEVTLDDARAALRRNGDGQAAGAGTGPSSRRRSPAR
jgi:hypothetical protein